MFGTTAATLFETNFIILLSFSLYHVKVGVAVIIKRAAKNSWWDRANVGVWGLITEPQVVWEAEPPAFGDFTIFQ